MLGDIPIKDYSSVSLYFSFLMHMLWNCRSLDISPAKFVAGFCISTASTQASTCTTKTFCLPQHARCAWPMQRTAYIYSSAAPRQPESGRRQEFIGLQTPWKTFGRQHHRQGCPRPWRCPWAWLPLIWDARNAKVFRQQNLTVEDVTRNSFSPTSLYGLAWLSFLSIALCLRDYPPRWNLKKKLLL